MRILRNVAQNMYNKELTEGTIETNPTTNDTFREAEELLASIIKQLEGNTSLIEQLRAYEAYRDSHASYAEEDHYKHGFMQGALYMSQITNELNAFDKNSTVGGKKDAN